MNDIYLLWVAAHGIMIVTPVNWYQPPSLVKLMMDRLVGRKAQPEARPSPSTFALYSQDGIYAVAPDHGILVR